MRKSWRGLPLAALFVALVAVRPGSAQDPARRVPDMLLPVSTELVRIDVVVTDKGGRPREGLTQDDFVVLEDGQPQKIAQFEAFVSVPRAAVPPPSSSATGTKAEDEGATDPASRMIQSRVPSPQLEVGGGAGPETSF